MVFTGASIVGLVLEERRRGRRPGCWGPGRWTWAFAGVYVVAVALDFLRDLAPLNRRRLLALEIGPFLFAHIFNRSCMGRIFVLGDGGMSLAVALAVAW
jgi:hypothetical protein